jgi:hypothetical protein
VTSEVVTRPVHAVADPYSSYADYVQQGGEQLSAQASDYTEQRADEHDEDDEQVWERLRANAQDESRTSDIAPRGAHAAWETPDGAYDAGQDEDAQYYAQQQQEAQYYAQQQQEAQYHAQQQEAQYHAQQQQEAQYYAQQQQEAQYYAQQQQEAQHYAQQQQAQFYAQQQQQAQYQAAQAFAAQNAAVQVSPYDATAAYAPAAASYGEQASWQQPAGAQTYDDSFEPKRGGGLKWFAVLLVGGGLAAGGVVGYPRVMQLKTAQVAPASMAALPAATSAPAAIGTEEARARDALFGTHTAPTPAPTPTPSVSAAAPSEPAAPAAALPAEAPSAPASEVAQAPAPAKTGALRTASAKKKAKRGKAGKAKKSAKLAAAPQRKPAKAKRPRGGASIAGGENSNDPLMGI